MKQFMMILFAAVLLFPQAKTKNDFHYLYILEAKDTGGTSNKIVFGVNTKSTFDYDASFKEIPAPPIPPPPIFEVRIMDRWWRYRNPNSGSYIDIRPIDPLVQIDTFLVAFRPMNELYPMTFTLRDSVPNKDVSIDVSVTPLNDIVARNLEKIRTFSISESNIDLLVIQIKRKIRQ